MTDNKKRLLRSGYAKAPNQGFKQKELSSLYLNFYRDPASSRNDLFRVLVKEKPKQPNVLPQSVDIQWANAFISTKDFSGEPRAIVSISSVATRPTAKRDKEGNLIDSKGLIVSCVGEAASVDEPIVDHQTGKPVYVTLGTLFTNDHSVNGRPYPQTMLTGRLWTMEEAVQMHEMNSAIKKLDELGYSDSAAKTRSELSQMKKEAGQHISAFPSKELLATFESNFNLPVRHPESSQNISKEARPATPAEGPDIPI